MDNKGKTGQAKKGEIDEQSLIDYLSGEMAPARRHELELLLEKDPFLYDALDGLSEIKDPEQLKIIAGQLNLQLRKNLRERRKERRTRKSAAPPQVWLYVLVVLALLLLSWWVISAFYYDR